MSDTRTEKLDNLYGDLCDCLAVLIHYYKGMLNDLAGDVYTPERAEQDFTALTYNEGHDVLGILAEIFAMRDDEKTQESDKG